MSNDQLSVILSLAERGDRQSAQRLVDEIGRQGKGHAYARALVVECGVELSAFTGLSADWIFIHDLFSLLTASPEQVAKAAREVLL